jgi:hypothetical protein
MVVSSTETLDWRYIWYPTHDWFLTQIHMFGVDLWVCLVLGFGFAAVRSPHIHIVKDTSVVVGSRSNNSDFQTRYLKSGPSNLNPTITDVLNCMNAWILHCSKSKSHVSASVLHRRTYASKVILGNPNIILNQP